MLFLQGQSHPAGEHKGKLLTVKETEGVKQREVRRCGGEERLSNLTWRRPELLRLSWTRCSPCAGSRPGGAGSPRCSPLWTASFAWHSGKKPQTHREEGADEKFRSQLHVLAAGRPDSDGSVLFLLVRTENMCCWFWSEFSSWSVFGLFWRFGLTSHWFGFGSFTFSLSRFKYSQFLTLNVNE